jgi:hypothetical protein
MDARAAHGVGRVEGTAWGATKVMGATREKAKVGEAGDGGATQGWAVRPLGVAVGLPGPVPWVV